MKLEQERLNDFQSRMSEWVAKQGLIFQLRYAGNVNGTGSSVFSTALRLLIRLVILLALSALAFWGFLVKRVDMEMFQTGLSERLEQSLGAETIEVRGIKRDRGFLKMSMINMIGGVDSFFEAADVRGIQTAMGLGDGILKSWRGDSIQMTSLTMQLKGGADSDEEASRAFQSLFWRSKNFAFRTIQVSETNLKWGYSSSTQGSIVGSKMLATRTERGWKIVLTGGQFSQNWLKKLEVQKIEIELTPDGFEIHQARLRNGEAEIGFSLDLVRGGAKPELQGRGSFTSLPVTDYIAPQYHDLIGGYISGTFNVSGSTNKQTGFKFEADLELAENDRIELRDQIKLFTAISVVDRLHSYKKVRLTKGRLKMTTEKGQAHFEELDLIAPRQMRLKGSVLVRPPTQEEVDAEIDAADQNVVGVVGEEGQEEDDGVFEFSLRKAATKESKAGEPAEREKEGSSLLFNKDYRERIGRSLTGEAIQRKKQEIRLDGDLKIGITEAAFESSPNLIKTFPLDPETNMRWLGLSFQGINQYEIGVELSDQILNLSGLDH